MGKHPHSDEAKKLKLPCAKCNDFDGLDRDFDILMVRCRFAPALGCPLDRLVGLVRARGCPGGTKSAQATAYLAKPPPDP